MADTAKLLLQAVNATDEASFAARQSNELLRLRYEREASRSKKESLIASDAPRTTLAGLKPWRMVIQPHPDVRDGEFTKAEFAADLTKVLRGEAAPEYGDAREFFRRTFLTEGLRDLIVNGISRLTGEGGDPVVQLQTNFGGGKTHSMLALYHAFGPDIELADLPEYDQIQERIGVTDDIKAGRAVLVGDALNVSQPRQHHDCTTRTLWGEIAWQLGGLEGYALVERNDLQGTNPGADTLVQLLEDHGPALIIIDELVHYARNLYNVSERLPAGTFDAVLSFVQSLTTAVNRSTDSLLLVSLPVSEIEIGGEGGQRALDYLSRVFGRLESVWKPVGFEESFEIVRRRLFSDVEDPASRDATISAFTDLYRRGSTEYPSECAAASYRQFMTQAYPIHPELFTRLYEDWSTMERFQRTRGVLRMMASVIHRLWSDNDDSLLIMPGSIPLWNGTVKSEILRYLPSSFPAVVDVDIDGDGSRPRQIERDVAQLQRHTACRRVARAIFMGSAPSVAGQSVRGVEEVRINLATVQPGESTGIFSDALRRMSNQLTYLYNDGTRYWYDTRPTVNRTAQDRAQGMSEYEILGEAGARLRGQSVDRRKLGSVHIMPETSAEVPDEQSARVVVLGPEHTHKSNIADSEAMQFIGEIMNSRGNSPRHHRNMLVFIAPDKTRNTEWEDSIRKYLAWISIERDSEVLNLDAQQSRQVTEAIKRENETIDKRLQETYCWLIVPQQPESSQPFTLDQERLSGSDEFLERAARKLKSNEWLINGLSPDNLLMELEPLGWRDMKHLSIKKLWEWLTNYCYLPRLYDRSVLEATIKDGVNRIGPAFAYATGVGEDGKYSGLALGRTFTLYFDDNALIVKTEVAQAQIEAERAAKQRETVPLFVDGGSASISTAVETLDDTPQPPKPKTRYHGSVQVDPQRAMRDLSQIADEIILRLASLPGAHVTITVEIESLHSEGFDDATVRTISENSRTLNFKSHSFEDR